MRINNSPLSCIRQTSSTSHILPRRYLVSPSLSLSEVIVSLSLCRMNEGIDQKKVVNCKRVSSVQEGVAAMRYLGSDEREEGGEGREEEGMITGRERGISLTSCCSFVSLVTHSVILFRECSLLILIVFLLFPSSHSIPLRSFIRYLLPSKCSIYLRSLHHHLAQWEVVILHRLIDTKDREVENVSDH